MHLTTCTHYRSGIVRLGASELLLLELVCAYLTTSPILISLSDHIVFPLYISFLFNHLISPRDFETAMSDQHGFPEVRFTHLIITAASLTNK